jgi:DNA-binding NtrC family response regulator
MPAPVIVVHDEADIREACLRALREAGHEVAGFDDATAALDAVEPDGRARVVVTRIDFGNGKLSGDAFARMLRYKRRGIKVVFIVRPENEVYADGPGEFVPESLDPKALVDAVGRALE